MNMKRPNQNPLAGKGKKVKTTEISDEVTQDVGIILSVSLQDFMCHDNLTFDLDPHINFIIGQNGSGKSAILTGIILALGGKSSNTGRYNNVKGFVKNGKNKAVISVTLKNCGPHAYKPDVYGEQITVEREIKSDGTSSYKLKNAEGKLVQPACTIKDELRNILIAMDIQVDNPVLVLTQDTSRNFLMAKTGKEEKLYEFFYKGTGLQKLEEDYQLSVSTNEECANDLAAKAQALEVMENEVKRLEKLRESDEKLDELKRESFWARIISMEKELKTQNTKKEKDLKQIEIIKIEVENTKNKFNEESLLLEKYEQERAEIEKKMSSERKSLSEFGVQKELCAGNVRRCQGEVDLYKREKKKLLADIHVIEEAINEHQMKDQTDYENERRQRNEQILLLEEKMSNAGIQQDQYEKEHEYILQEQNSKQQEINMLKSEINDLNYKKNMRTKEHSQLISSKKNRQLLFGDQTPLVLQEIQRNRHRFKKLPKGPIGLDIEVKDSKWISAVETCIKPNLLRSFCVDNPEDSVLMTQILQKYYTDRMPSVIVSPFLPRVHDVSYHKAQTNIPTVLDMLIMKDPVTANCLIDQLSVENKILIEDTTTAQSIMLDRPPDKCYSAFLLNCDEILLNPYRYYSASWKPANLLSRTVDASYLEKLQEEIRTLDSEIILKESAMAEVRLQLQNYPDKLKKLGKRIVEITTLKSDTLGRIEELKQFDEPRNVPEMHDEFSSLKADLEKKQGELNEAEKKLAEYTVKYKEVIEKLNHQRELVSNMTHKHDSLGNSRNTCSRHKEYLASSIKNFEANLKVEEKQVRNLEYEIEQADEGIKKTIADRKKVDKKPRIPTTRSYEEIDMQIGEMQKVISEQSNSKDKASLLQKYTEKNKRLYEAKIEFKVIERHRKQIAKMMKKREKKTHEIFKYTQFIVNYSFGVLLSGNGFSGQLKFDRPILQLTATKKENQESSGKKSSSSLSGGERSFVTISFLIALWQRIQMPFRILDEYDVFMDSNNRHLSINLLISKANEMLDTQFIFLSPLELPEFKDSNANIKVHKMQPPERIGLTNIEE